MCSHSSILWAEQSKLMIKPLGRDCYGVVVCSHYNVPVCQQFMVGAAVVLLACRVYMIAFESTEVNLSVGQWIIQRLAPPVFSEFE